MDRVKHELLRARQKVLVAVGNATQTVDTSYNEQKTTFDEHYKLLKKLGKDAHRVLDLYKELSIIQSTLAQDFDEIFDGDGELAPSVSSLTQSVKEIDAARMQFDEKARNQCLTPLSNYMGQFKEIEERMKERDNRLLDMDRYKWEMEHKSSSIKQQPHKEKYDLQKQNYDALNDELMEDIPKLYADRFPFFDPAFASWATENAEMYKTFAKSSGNMLQFINHINRQDIKEHPSVITGKDTSAAYHTETPNQLTSSSSGESAPNE